MRFGKDDLRNLKSSESKEYLLTNGIGGFCSSSISGTNIRKYSALLVASCNPPVDRKVMLSKLDEIIYIGKDVYTLSSNERINRENDEGYVNQVSFEENYFPCFKYNIRGVMIEKKITMEYGKNTTIVKYKIKNNNKIIKMRIDPLINNRNHHALTKKGDFKCEEKIIKNGVKIKYNINNTLLYMKSDKAIYNEHGKWYEGMYYNNEFERGLDFEDAHYIPGYFEIYVEPHEEIEFSIIASTEPIKEIDGSIYFKEEIKRKEELINKLSYKDKLTKILALACDQFIVKRKSTGKATVIAGYPWFTDWGRDTMISLPGLTLVTGRYEEAKELLITFAKYINKGLIPNMFPDNGIKPLYNTVDGTLWYFNAVYKYLQYTNDYEFIEKNIFYYLTEIMENHIKGTMFNIGMDEDYLLKAGNKDLQLTWMDVKINGETVTPRQGKAVEINALWYNAVCIYSMLCKRFGENNTKYEELANHIKDSFLETFWNKKENYFYDYVDGEHKNNQIRPNAIITLSLPFTMVNESMAKKTIETALEKLYTPYGLRSLNEEDKEYKGIYLGDVEKRDHAYHQGTVWSWLIGPFITAVNRWYKDKELCKDIVAPFYDHLEDCCIGNISEVFDGDSPHISRGCFAQAWGVAELLRSYIEDINEIQSKEKIKDKGEICS